MERDVGDWYGDGGIPLLEKSWFVRSWFLGFLVSKLLGFKFSWSQSFKVPYIHHISMSCFLEDIDLISKILKNLLDGSFGFSGTRLFPKNKMSDFPHFEIYKKKRFEIIRYFLGVVSVSWCLQRYKYLVLGPRDTSESPEIIEMRDLRFLTDANRKVISSN